MPLAVAYEGSEFGVFVCSSSLKNDAERASCGSFCPYAEYVIGLSREGNRVGSISQSSNGIVLLDSENSGVVFKVEYALCAVIERVGAYSECGKLTCIVEVEDTCHILIGRIGEYGGVVDRPAGGNSEVAVEHTVCAESVFAVKVFGAAQINVLEVAVGRKLAFGRDACHGVSLDIGLSGYGSVLGVRDFFNVKR